MTFTQGIFLDDTNVIKTPVYEEKQFPGGIGVECFSAMKKYEKNVAQIDAATGDVDTFDVILKHSIRTAIEMRSRGITDKDIIGARFTAFDPALTIDDIKHLLKVVTPKLLFVEASAMELVKHALSEICNTHTEIVSLNDNETEKYTSFYNFLAPKVEEENFKPTVVEDGNRTAMILCSSGTTGLPKGIEHTHHVILNKVHQFPASGLVMLYSSLYWISTMVVFISQTLLGEARLLLGNFQPSTACNYLDKYEIPVAVLTTVIATDLINYANSNITQFRGLKMLSIIGDKVSQSIVDNAKLVFPNAIVLKGYGLTETAGVLTAFSLSDDDLGLLSKNPKSVGRPIAGVTYKVVHVETGKNLSFNQLGELCIKSKYAMKGYYNLESSAAYDENGWLRTGDMVYFDHDFCFYVIDRIKEVIKYRIWHIAPALLESVLNSHPAVAASIVMGIPNEEDGEHPIACVILKKNAESVNEIELKKFVDEKVDNRKKLRGGIRFVNSFPLTPTGKIARRKLKESLVKVEL